YSRSTTEKLSDLWTAVDHSTDLDELKKIASEQKNTMPGRIARFNIARVMMQEALGRLASTLSDERVKAAHDLEEATKTYSESPQDWGFPQLLIQEALLAEAKAEETLYGVPKESDQTVMRGSLDQALRLYSELAKKYPNTMDGEAAAKRAKEITEKRSEIE